MLPFLAATHPAAARAMLEYRVRRLPAARRTARAAGPRRRALRVGVGAHAAPTSPRARRATAPGGWWRSTPASARSTSSPTWRGRPRCYVDWTGDEAFRAGPGRGCSIETARYWASRVERDGDGRAHIRGVIGPDEYHEHVDDNAYTNVMARWNLRRAYAETADAAAASTEAERATWRAARRRARRRLSARERALRAVRGLLRARAAGHRRARAAAARSPPTCCSRPSAWPAPRSSSRPTC